MTPAFHRIAYFALLGAVLVLRMATEWDGVPWSLRFTAGAATLIMFAAGISFSKGFLE